VKWPDLPPGGNPTNQWLNVSLFENLTLEGAVSHSTGKLLFPKGEVTPFPGIGSFQPRTQRIKDKWILYLSLAPQRL